MRAKNSDGPYREHKPPQVIKEPWWLGPKRTLRSVFGWLGKKSRPFAIALTAAAAPSIVAHLTGHWSWHWTAVHALLAVSIWAGVSMLGDGHPAPWIVGGLAYLGSIMLMAYPPTGAGACNDEVEYVGGAARCSHQQHEQEVFEFDSKLYVRCRCRR